MPSFVATRSFLCVLCCVCMGICLDAEKLKQQNSRLKKLTFEESQAVVKAAQKAKELDAQHVGVQIGMLSTLQKAKELDAQHVGVATGVSSAYQSARGSVAGQILTAAKETAQPLLEKAKLAGNNMVEKVKSFDEQNQVSQKTVAAVGKTKEAAKEALTKVSSLDEKYQVSTKLQSGLTSGFNALSGMVRRAGATAGGAVEGKEGL